MKSLTNRGLRLVYPLAVGARALRRSAIGLMQGRTFGVRMLVERDGQFCLIRHSYGNRTLWMAPGGGVDWHEQPKDAAIRETAEEVGITALNEVRLVYAYVHQIGWVDDVVVVYASQTDQDFQYVSSEIDEIAWFPPDRLPERTTDGTRQSLCTMLAS